MDDSTSSTPPVSASQAPSPSTTSDASDISITVQFSGRAHTFNLPASSVLDDLIFGCESILGEEYDWPSSKLIAPPPAGLLKAADKADFALAPLHNKSLRLMVSKTSAIASLNAASADARKRQLARREAMRRGPRASRSRGTVQTLQEDATYTFLQVRPLAHMPNPQRSHDFLLRLKNDRGIRAAMRAHKFTVGLLTEMDPAAYTESTHEGTTRILGLNRNKGEVIELRLRTDAGDGYRDYRTIRKTLCHELAHNVHGPHDRNFWDLCHQIEKEVDRADWEFGGRTAGGEAPVYDPREVDEDVPDHGGWTGGEFVLGGAAGSGRGLSRREILAKAAEERMRRMNEESPPGNNGEGSSK